MPKEQYNRTYDNGKNLILVSNGRNISWDPYIQTHTHTVEMCLSLSERKISYCIWSPEEKHLEKPYVCQQCELHCILQFKKKHIQIHRRDSNLLISNVVKDLLHLVTWRDIYWHTMGEALCLLAMLSEFYWIYKLEDSQ